MTAVFDFVDIKNSLKTLGQRSGLFEPPANNFIYTYKNTGSVKDHCSNCPLKLNEECKVTCSSNIERLTKERQEDGIIVTE